MDELLSRATLAYFGVGLRAWPNRDPEQVRLTLGEVAVDLIPRIKEVEDEVNARAVEWASMPYDEALTATESMIRAGHPELGDEAVAAFIWAYAYDWK